MEKKIVAVVVTYNRLELLARCVEHLRLQTIKNTKIVVVNNGSSDGTKEWLDNQQGLMIIHQDNLGGSGGFYRGIQEAYDCGADWIWCMDDDVFPEPTCLEKMLKYSKEKNVGILCPKRLMDGKIFVSESKTLNLSNPFIDMHNNSLTPADLQQNEFIEIVGMSFEGPLIKRDVVAKIGLPNKELFILFDDTDYSYRAFLNGFRVLLISSAEMVKYDFKSTASLKEIKMKNKWKLSYHIRNTAYFGHKYGKNIFVRNLAAAPFLMRMYMAITFNFIKGHKYKFSDYKLFWNMMVRGLKGQLGRL